MRDAGIGRILVASLHQAISDLLPTRLEFYENWLNAEGLRNGRIGLAPLAAVLSFLRQEGDAYALITARAGEYAADWTIAGLPAFERSMARKLPAPWRARVALRFARRMVRESYKNSRALLRFRRGAGKLDIRGSIFCGVRQKVSEPLCGFYAAAASRFLESFNLAGQVRITECLAVGGSACHLTLVIHRPPKPRAGEDIASGPLSIHDQSEPEATSHE
jgi:hypothetical protein